MLVFSAFSPPCHLARGEETSFSFHFGVRPMSDVRYPMSSFFVHLISHIRRDPSELGFFLLDRSWHVDVAKSQSLLLAPSGTCLEVNPPPFLGILKDL